MKKYTQKELEQIFENRFDCYADTTDESVVMAMSKERYIEVLKELKILNIQNVSGSLAYQKAVEYAKFIHGEEYEDPIFAPDVEQTIRDFQSGFVTAMRIANDR